jgi:hypothetical protein
MKRFFAGLLALAVIVMVSFFTVKNSPESNSFSAQNIEALAQGGEGGGPVCQDIGRWFCSGTIPMLFYN